MSSAAPMSDPVPALPVSHPRRRRWLYLLATLILVIGCSVFLWQRYTQGPLESLPVVILDRCGPGERGAIEEAYHFVRRRPRSGPAWGRLGMVLLAHNFEDAATTCFSIAQNYDPLSAPWPYCAGVCLSISNPQRAMEQFEKAEKLAPTTPFAKFRRAELLMDQQRLDEASQILESIADTDQNVRLAYDRTRLALLHSGPDALRALDPNELRELESGVNRRTCLELLAQVWQRLGQPQKSDAATQKLRTETAVAEGWEDPYVSEVMSLRKDPQWQAGLARQAFDRGQADDAILQMTQLVADYPADPQWAIQLASMLNQRGNRPQAISTLKAASRRHPNSAELRFELGNISFQGADWTGAVAAYSTAVSLKPDYDLAHYNLAHSHLKLGDNPAAIKAFRNAIRCRSDFAAAHVNLGDLLSRTQQPDDLLAARQHLQRALMLTPNDRRATELLDRLPKP